MSPTLTWKLLESFLFMAHAAWSWQQQMLLIQQCTWAAAWAFLIYTSSYIKTTPGQWTEYFTIQLTYLKQRQRWDSQIVRPLSLSFYWNMKS